MTFYRQAYGGETYGYNGFIEIKINLERLRGSQPMMMMMWILVLFVEEWRILWYNVCQVDEGGPTCYNQGLYTTFGDMVE